MEVVAKKQMKFSDCFSRPCRGDTLFVFKGGPLDSQELWIDSDTAPKMIYTDGHEYERVVILFKDICDERGKYMNDPEEPFEFEYRYKGKPG